MSAPSPKRSAQVLLVVGLLLAACDQRATQSPEQALRTAGVDLAGAVEAARQSQPDGQVVEAEFEQRGERALYEVAVLVNGEVREVLVDPKTGAVISTEVDAEDLEEGRASAKLLEEAKIGLVEAIGVAEREVTGRAFQVEIGEAGFEVLVLGDAGAWSVTLDLAGAVLTKRETAGVEQEDEDGEDEDDDDDQDDDEVKAKDKAKDEANSAK